GNPPAGCMASVVVTNNSHPHRWRPARCCLTAPRNKVPRPGRGGGARGGGQVRRRGVAGGAGWGGGSGRGALRGGGGAWGGGCGSSRGSNAFTTTDGSSQAVVLVNADRLSLQQQIDIFNAVAIGICGSG